MSRERLRALAWFISVTTLVLAITAWGQRFRWQLSGLTTYQLFPLFGLAAFSLMWSHYIVSALRHRLKYEKAVLQSYFEITSLIVLAAILLHPGLLAWQLWRDGAGLLPASELNYVRPALRGAVVLGMIGWVLFLAYEFRRKYQAKNWWKYVQYANDMAMVLIFLHAFRLGNSHWPQWFKGVWFFYALTFGLALFTIYYAKRHQRTIAKK